MFSFKKTAAYAYLLNGMFTLIGIITMTHFSIKYWPKEWDVSTVLFGTLFPGILICAGAFMLGKIIFEMTAVSAANIDQKHRSGRFFRYPNMGFWGVHLAVLSAVYTLGHLLWK